MELSGQYLTYEEYRGLGGTLDLMPFNLLEFEARKQIDLRTQNRLKNLDTIPSEVKMCMFSLINKIQYYAQATANADANVVNESIDGYSITYIGASQVNQVIASKNVELQDIIMNDLYGVEVNGTHLIYNGVQ